jgi:hypothetical protein
MRRSLAVVLVLVATGCGATNEATTVTETTTLTETTTVTETLEPGQASTSYEGIQTPSKNIGCIVALEAGYSSMRCAISEYDNPPPKRPNDCDWEWGNIVFLPPDFPGGWECSGEIFHPDHPLITLAYGKTWRRGAFECRSLRTGLRCRNIRDYGLFLSRERQTFR